MINIIVMSKITSIFEKLNQVVKISYLYETPPVLAQLVGFHLIWRHKMNDIKTFVLLKYEILTSDQSTWHLCETYPAEIRSKWAWRCAGDVEHLAKGHVEAEEYIQVAKLYRDGKASKKELDEAYHYANYVNDNTDCTTVSSHYSVRASHYAATTHFTWASSKYAAYAANEAIMAAIDYTTNPVINASIIASRNAANGEKWNLYISWLIEELCEYEKNNGDIK